MLSLSTFLLAGRANVVNVYIGPDRAKMPQVKVRIWPKADLTSNASDVRLRE